MMKGRKGIVSIVCMEGRFILCWGIDFRSFGFVVKLGMVVWCVVREFDRYFRWRV